VPVRKCGGRCEGLTTQAAPRSTEANLLSERLSRAPAMFESGSRGEGAAGPRGQSWARSARFSRVRARPGIAAVAEGKARHPSTSSAPDKKRQGVPVPVLNS